MIPLVIDSTIFFSAIYNEIGIERKLLDLSLMHDQIQLFSLDLFKEEITGNLTGKVRYMIEYIHELISKYDIIEVPKQKHENMQNEVKGLVSHEEDVPFIAASLFLNCPIWSGNSKHFGHFKDSK